MSRSGQTDDRPLPAALVVELAADDGFRRELGTTPGRYFHGD